MDLHSTESITFDVTGNNSYGFCNLHALLASPDEDRHAFPQNSSKTCLHATIIIESYFFTLMIHDQSFCVFLSVNPLKLVHFVIGQCQNNKL